MRRTSRRAPPQTRLSRPARLLSCALATLLLLRLLRPRRDASAAPGASTRGGDSPRAGRCVAWRATQCGSQYTTRLPLEDLSCSTVIHPADKRMSGYCECGDQRLHMAEVALLCGKGLKAEWKRARIKAFTCEAACADKWRRHGPSQKEDPLEGCDAVREADAAEQSPADWGAIAPPDLAPAARTAVRALWAAMDAAFVSAGGLDVVLPPGRRGFGGTREVDFVAAGKRMPPHDVAEARQQLSRFRGGMQYMPPAWVAVHALRRVGCKLPVEMWFAMDDMPDQGLADALRQLGVAVRNVEEVGMGSGAPPLRGFMLKVVAILFSRFEEVLYLDADNVALGDPTSLFDSPQLARSGLLLWPDFWPPSIAPDAYVIAPEAARHAGNASRGAAFSVESGQLVVVKSTAWRGLLITWFLNMQAPLWYRLMGSYMGTGDKDTWAFGAAVAGGPPPWIVAFSAGSVGVRGMRHPEHLLSNTMVQHHPVYGQPLFAHSNLFKWALDVPVNGSAYARRWRVMTPPLWSAAKMHHGAPPIPVVPASQVLVDAEAAAWRALRLMRCGPWFDAWMLKRRARHGEIHPDGYDPAQGVPAYRGMLLAEHAGGWYDKGWEWSWRSWTFVRVAA